MVSKHIQIEALAPAKINLHLSIGKRRNDGFHSLLSIFQMIDLADRIAISIEPQTFLSIAVDMLGMEAVENNTMELAASLFMEEAGITGDVKIECKKRIPHKAGLGGGSSDAATVLLMLNRAYGYPMETSRLREVGAQIGSDVPFFLGESAGACVEGRGEYLTPLTHRNVLYGLVLMPHGEGVSTAKAFSNLDAYREANGIPPKLLAKDELVAMYAKDPKDWHFTNDFRPVMGTFGPWYDRLDALVAGYPGCFGTLSGSGSAYAIVGEKRENLMALRTKLEIMVSNVTIYDIKSLHRSHSGDTVIV